MGFKKIRNDRGVVMVTVLVIIIVMMIVTVSIISMNVSQVMVTESEVKRIQAEMLAQGAISYYSAVQQATTPPPLGDAITWDENNDGRNTYSMEITRDLTNTGIFNTSNILISVDY